MLVPEQIELVYKKDVEPREDKPCSPTFQQTNPNDPRSNTFLSKPYLFALDVQLKIISHYKLDNHEPVKMEEYRVHLDAAKLQDLIQATCMVLPDSFHRQPDGSVPPVRVWDVEKTLADTTTAPEIQIKMQVQHKLLKEKGICATEMLSIAHRVYHVLERLKISGRTSHLIHEQRKMQTSPQLTGESIEIFERSRTYFMEARNRKLCMCFSCLFLLICFSVCNVVILVIFVVAYFLCFWQKYCNWP